MDARKEKDALGNSLSNVSSRCYVVQSSFAITILAITIILAIAIFPGQTKILLH